VTELDGWDNFYVILGSSAGALIGLQFVVMTLLAEIPLTGRDMQAGNAFGTPNVVHFSVVLLLSAMVVVPWHGIEAVAVLWGVTGIAGIVYAMIVIRRMRSQQAYETVFEDWLFHAWLPILAYAMLAASSGMAFAATRPALFMLGAASLLLLFIGIHNAWDTVVYHIFVRRQSEAKPERDENE
jgi:hypothetical protein